MARLTIFVVVVLAIISTIDCVKKLSKRRIKAMQRKLTDIDRKLDKLLNDNGACNDTLYDVTIEVGDVKGFVSNLYATPPLGNVDVSTGYSKRKTLYVDVPDPVDACIKAYEGTRVSSKQARLNCLQKVLWRYEEPVPKRTIDGYRQKFKKYDTRKIVEKEQRSNKAWRSSNKKRKLQAPPRSSQRNRIFKTYGRKPKGRKSNGYKPPIYKPPYPHTTAYPFTTDYPPTQYPPTECPPTVNPPTIYPPTVYPPSTPSGVTPTDTPPTPTDQPSTPTVTPPPTPTLTPPPTPPPFLRVRKSYLRLTDEERERFHAAMNVLYDTGIIAAFAEMHRLGAPGAHGGPAFLPWHRSFITRFEDALREVDPTVTLPYWDSTLVDCMDNPVNSIIWTDKYFGNGMGDVITGPCAYWETSNGLLRRSYGINARLISNIDIGFVLSECYFADISLPSTGPTVLEQPHNNVHVYVGGHMGSVARAPFDMIFYLHHCFVDYVWELFRLKQFFVCDVDPETDYPDIAGVYRSGPNRYEDNPSVLNNCYGLSTLELDLSAPCCATIPRLNVSEIVPPEQEMVTAAGASGDTVRSDQTGQARAARRSECDQYLDPYCYASKVAEDAKQNKMIQPADEYNLYLTMLPEYHGPLPVFEGGPSDGRTLKTARYDAERRAYRRKTGGYKGFKYSGK